MAKMAFRGTPKQERELRKFIRKHKDQPGAMMPVLQEAQGIYGYLPREVQEDECAALTGIWRRYILFTVHTDA